MRKGKRGKFLPAASHDYSYVGKMSKEQMFGYFLEVPDVEVLMKDPEQLDAYIVRLDDIRKSPQITESEKRRVIGPHMPNIRAIKARREAEIKDIEQDRDSQTDPLKEMLTREGQAEGKMYLDMAQKLFDEWADCVPKLQHNDCTRFHKMNEALKSAIVIGERKDKVELVAQTVPVNELGLCQVFVVEHDWLGAIGHALEIKDEEVRLPYEYCAFEFRVNDKNLIVLCTQNEQGKMHCQYLVGMTGDVWLQNSPTARKNAVFDFAWNHIKSICVALDAEVAVTEVIRAPPALNEKRVKKGKLPLKDYHIVKLGKKHSAERLGGQPTGRHVRSHYRRGHWRHYSDHKTWIRWQIIGDPSYGFVEKEYRI